MKNHSAKQERKMHTIAAFFSYFSLPLHLFMTRQICLHHISLPPSTPRREKKILRNKNHNGKIAEKKCKNIQHFLCHLALIFCHMHFAFDVVLLSPSPWFLEFRMYTVCGRAAQSILQSDAASLHWQYSDVKCESKQNRWIEMMQRKRERKRKRMYTQRGMRY